MHTLVYNFRSGVKLAVIYITSNIFYTAGSKKILPKKMQHKPYFITFLIIIILLLIVNCTSCLEEFSDLVKFVPFSFTSETNKAVFRKQEIGLS
jgi:amino acid transporter